MHFSGLSYAQKMWKNRLWTFLSTYVCYDWGAINIGPKWPIFRDKSKAVKEQVNKMHAHLIFINGSVSGKDDKDGVWELLLVRLLFLALLKEPEANSSSEELSSEDPRIKRDKRGFFIFESLGLERLPLEGPNFNCFGSSSVEEWTTSPCCAWAEELIPASPRHSSDVEGPATSSCCKCSEWWLFGSMVFPLVHKEGLYPLQVTRPLAFQNNHNTTIKEDKTHTTIQTPRRKTIV